MPFSQHEHNETILFSEGMRVSKAEARMGKVWAVAAAKSTGLF